MNKEQLYDTAIAPLMEQIIALCKDRGIAMLASFSIPTDDDPDLACTTVTPDETGENNPAHLHALKFLFGDADSVMTIMVENADGSREVTSVVMSPDAPLTALPTPALATAAHSRPGDLPDPKLR